MINHIDNLLRHLFITQINEISDEGQVGFQPPDDKWLTHVAGLNGNALNVFLADVRENRKLRSNARTRTFENGNIIETLAPARIDCHYLISAWSPATETPQIESTIDEHGLLYKAIAVLMNREVLTPRQIYDPDPLPADFPEAIANAELPLSILPVEGFGKLPEFWGTVNYHWKPMIYLVITLPVTREVREAGEMVSTRRLKLAADGGALVEGLMQIGGRVHEAGNPRAVIEGASVRLVEKDQTVITNARGEFSFSGLIDGTTYTLEVSHEGNVTTKTISVPGSSPTAFDVEITV